MAVPSNQLDAMGLSDRAQGDIHPMHKDYAIRLQYQNAIIATDHPDRPCGNEIFSTAQSTSNHAARCNLPSPIVICSATILGAGPAGANIVLAPDTYYMKKEGKAWIEKYITWNNGESKDTRNMQLASSPNSYSVDEYYEYLSQTMRSCPDYTTAYFNKHTAAQNLVPLVEMSLISPTMHY